MSNIAEQINILIEVQGVEKEILQAGRQLDVLSGEAVSLDQEAATRETRMAEEKKALADLKKAYRELESESKINRELIVKSNEKLRGVKTNKEYQSILKEIEDIRKKNSGIDDRMLDHLEKLEAAEKALAEQEAELERFIQSCREKKKTLIAREQDERQTVDTLNEKRMQVSAKADPKMISTLDEVKKKVRGMAVVPVEGAICMGCHMNIPAQLYNELQRFDELRFCPHCHRIIYWQNKDSE
jgi:predicted  nucleic acid-binding Zn-ribbon protein